MSMKKLFTLVMIASVTGICILYVPVIKSSLYSSITKLESRKNAEVLKDSKASADICDFIPYRVKKGDTVYGICRESVIAMSPSKAGSMIIEKNNLKGNEDLEEGQIIYIPYKDPGHSIEYVVRNGDTIYTIAGKLMPGQDMQESVENIIEKNDLTSARDIEEGQILLIPYEE